MNKKIAIIQQIEVNELEKLDIECEECKIYSDNAEGAKLSADILDEKADEFEENGDTLNAKKVGKQAMKNYIESIELNQKAILASDVNEDVFEVQGFKNLDKAKHSHNNEAINKVLESKGCNILTSEDIGKMKDLFSSKKSPYNECRYGAELPEHSKRKDIKEIAEKVGERKKEVENKIKKSKTDKNEIVLKDGSKIIINSDKDN
ncbi:MAG: hypothetical protein SOZ71_02370 [Clostridium sp.]|nr:hypothetical protein [Clostridium sp.]